MGTSRAAAEPKVAQRYATGACPVIEFHMTKFSMPILRSFPIGGDDNVLKRNE